MITKGMMSSNKNNWETPQWLFDEILNEFHLEVDVCANYTNRKLNVYFDKQTDGLSREWDCETGGYWMNPPYGREIIKWVKKAYDSNQKHNSLIVALLPARTDTKWFHDFIYNKAEIRFIKGRLKFSGSKNSAPFPSMIVIWRIK